MRTNIAFEFGLDIRQSNLGRNWRKIQAVKSTAKKRAKRLVQPTVVETPVLEATTSLSRLALEEQVQYPFRQRFRIRVRKVMGGFRVKAENLSPSDQRKLSTHVEALELQHGVRIIITFM